MTDQFATFDAAYLLGALTPQDRADYEEHLAGCPDCRHSVHELAGLPGLLGSVPVEQALRAGEPGPDVPVTLLPRLLAEVERARFRRRWTSGVIGAAAAAVIAVLVVVGVHATSQTDPARQAETPVSLVRHMVPVAAGVPITATAHLDAKTWGTLIRIRCVYHEASQPPGEHYPQQGVTYSMLVTDGAGHSREIADWVAVPGQPAVVDGSTSLMPDEIASLEVVGPDRKPVLTLEP